jgi:hypothetical protein
MRKNHCEKCEDRGDNHSSMCLVKRWIFNEPQIRHRKSYAMEQAIKAIQNNRLAADLIDMTLIHERHIVEELAGNQE